jgi:hypothetical protein
MTSVFHLTYTSVFSFGRVHQPVELVRVNTVGSEALFTPSISLREMQNALPVAL